MTQPRLVRSALAAAILLLLAGLQSSPALHLPKIFSDHMVLQRDQPVKVWGWAEPGQKVSVTFAGQTQMAQAEAGGKWMVTLPAMTARVEPSALEVAAGEQKVTIQNVVVGEVWICSGQSNMEWTLGGTHNPQEAIAAAQYPLIRHFKVPHVLAVTPQSDLPGDWKVCSPDTAKDFTGVGYHFGRELHLALEGVPIGLINTSWGGTRIEPWTDPKGFTVSPKLQSVLERIERAEEAHRKNVAAYLDKMEQWTRQSRQALGRQESLPEFPGNLPEHPLKKPQEPTAIFNAMVAPLIPYTMRGAIWYQGESNNGEGMLYHEKMKALISSWRRLWSQGDFPFLFVQLAPYRYKRPLDLPGIWEAQLASLSIPNTGMAVTTDIGNVSDIHPRNKQEVGRRLSLWALAKTYGKNGLTYSGPLYDSVQFKGHQAVVAFRHAEGLQALDGQPLTWFTIAGADQKFVPARAVIQGKSVVVSSEEVREPVAVRFAWDETAEPNLANGARLPASPFRTDQW